MGYVESSLMPNEHVVASGKVHWWVFVQGILLVLIGVVLLFAGQDNLAIVFLGVLVFAAGAAKLVRAFLLRISTELAITNRRVIAKFGFIKRSTIELLHKNVESFHVEQSIMGRVLNFGTVVINGTGGVRTPIPNISDPLEFRRQALTSIESSEP